MYCGLQFENPDFCIYVYTVTYPPPVALAHPCICACICTHMCATWRIMRDHVTWHSASACNFYEIWSASNVIQSFATLKGNQKTSILLRSNKLSRQASIPKHMLKHIIPYLPLSYFVWFFIWSGNILDQPHFSVKKKLKFFVDIWFQNSPYWKASKQRRHWNQR